MKRLFRSGIILAALAATTLTTMPAANAGHWDRHRHYRHYHDNDSGDALAAGILGAAVGALATGVLVQPPRRVYIDPPAPRYRYRTYEPAPVYQGRVYYGAPEPWTSAWYNACDARYRSFDPSSGTFLGYDGQRHFCVVN